jgi:hypothetical protein
MPSLNSGIVKGEDLTAENILNNIMKDKFSAALKISQKALLNSPNSSLLKIMQGLAKAISSKP